jgi:polyphenol oxidase
MAHADWLRPAWRVEGVGALMTTRAGGIGVAPFDTFNLREGIGDDAEAVAHHRRLLAEAAGGAAPVWLNQVHGANVVPLTEADVHPGAPIHDADGSVTDRPGIACTAQVADCLPVLFAAPGGRAVGAAHAGWRGLAAGVVEATLARVCTLGGCEPAEVQAWLGACIGPAKFEVGADVLDAFGVLPREGASPRFVAHAPGKWLADLPSLARDRLHAAGVRSVAGGSWCTASEPSRFFSFRRDRVTGRMAAVVWIERHR